MPFISCPAATPQAAPPIMAAIRKKPPDRLLCLAMPRHARQTANAPPRCCSKDGQHSVDDLYRQSRNAASARTIGMDIPFITGKVALTDAAELIERFGDDAGFEAAARAQSSRDAGNVVRFCHWRQIERVIETLSNAEVRGTVH